MFVSLTAFSQNRIRVCFYTKYFSLNIIMKLIFIIFSSIMIHISGSIKSPIILIPGLGGSPIDVKFDQDADIKSRCKKNTKEFFKVWLNVPYALTHTPSCIYECLKMTYDTRTRKTSNRRGIHTRMPGFIVTNTNECLTTTKFVNPYFNKLVDKMVQAGWTLEVSIRAAMFDFRKGPGEHTQYFQDLKLLIETTYSKNGQQRIVLISHSMGGLVTLLFLQEQRPEWKKQYIRFLITLSAPWGGAVKAVEAYYRGFGLHGLEFSTKCSKFSDNIPLSSPFPYIIWPALKLAPKKLLRTWPGLIWMFPSSLAWKQSDVLLRKKDKQYALGNIKEFFDDMEEPTGWEMYQDITPFLSKLSKPDVELYCLYGTEIPTVASVYSKSSMRFPINGNGDGIVNLKSLEVCNNWVDETATVTVKAYKNIHHQSILSDSNVIDYIINLINEN